MHGSPCNSLKELMLRGIMVTWNGMVQRWCVYSSALTWYYTHRWILPCSIISAGNGVVSQQSGPNVTEIKCCTPHRIIISTVLIAICNFWRMPAVNWEKQSYNFKHSIHVYNIFHKLSLLIYICTQLVFAYHRYNYSPKCTAAHCAP